MRAMTRIPFPVRRVHVEIPGAMQAARRPAGFTVVELLVVIGLVALLVSLVIVSMAGIRAAANRADSVSALRQMISGYTLYSNDHQQHLLPGYILPEMIDPNLSPPAGWIEDLPLEGRLADRTPLEPGDLSSYVWRLAPYLDHEWRTMFADYKNPATMSRLDEAYVDGWYGPASALTEPFNLATMPSFGLNSIFLGGDTLHGGEYALDRSPWQEEVPEGGAVMAATRLAQVKNPAWITVFGPVGRLSSSPTPEDPYERIDEFEHELGYMELRPPFVERGYSTNIWVGRQWQIGLESRIERPVDAASPQPGEGVGLPIVRWGTSEYPIARLDGSADVVEIGELSSDMRRWSPFETGLDVPGFEP